MFPNLRAEMARRGLTVALMSSKLGMNSRTLGNKMAGKTEFTWREITQIHSTFFPQLTIDYLFERGEHSNTA